MILQGKHIAVEGVIGVGKTSLSTMLSEEKNGKLVLEIVEKNPFLSDFYNDKENLAFQTQIFFLFSRYHQQEELMQFDLFKQTVFTDYIFEKDKIFAYLNLSEKEISLYEKIYNLLVKKVPKPDLVVYLQASTEVLMERIKRRGREFERNIEINYIEELNQAYNYFFFHYEASPLLVINSNSLDFVHRPEDFKKIFKEINNITGGKKYFNPGNDAEL
ncbi:deoxynucleoside kinase [Candidatus Dependentiae bacterium]|nr:deoxynucleoside kinase [Candidatus Dependentiae bacterium]